jgi:hypothetical protein
MTYLGVLIAATTIAMSAAQESPRLIEPIVDLRLRMEHVDQSSMSEDAEAWTLRGRLGFETATRRSNSLLAEAEFVTPFEARYNSSTNGRVRYPMVADPEGAEVNRLQVTNTVLPRTTVVLGRQRIVLDDQRFLANVGWRQNEQTFDALRATIRPKGTLTLDVIWIAQVNRVFGRDSPLGRYDGDSFAANAGLQLAWGRLSGFSYRFDFDQAPGDSSSTSGLRFAGERTVSQVKLGYAGSWAHQTDHGANPVRYGADYHALELSGAVREWMLMAGMEVLGGDGIKGFATPLATLHKFQGWSDKFLTTPPDGISDRYASLSFTTRRVQPFDTIAAVVVFHDFDAKRTTQDYGSEVDLQLEAKWQRVRATVKCALYDAAQFAADTTKYWAQVELIW